MVVNAIEAVAALVTFASKVHHKLCQVQTNREEVASLQLRMNLLMHCLNHPKTPHHHKEETNSILTICQKIRAILQAAEALAEEFASASRVHQFVWTDHWAKQCQHINRKVSEYIQLLGVASDQQQLDRLNDIQAQLASRRKHDVDVSGQLRLLRQAVLEIQRLNYRCDPKETTASLKHIQESLANSTSTAATLTSDDDASLATTTVDVSGLPSHIQELFQKAEYRLCLLDSPNELKFEARDDSPSGTFGIVHQGTYLKQPVAVKVLINQELTARAIQEILEETLLLKKNNFDYFVTVHGICFVESSTNTNDGNHHTKKSPAIVMKRMDSDLFRFLHRSVRPDLKQSMSWKFQTAHTIAQAVEALHKLGILHRDLKSLNILVSGTNADKICITDFDMACIRRETASPQILQTAETGKHETIGSYPWMAPEIMKAGKYTEKADVYSLGVILWEVFTWKEPWSEAISIRAIEHAVCSGTLLDTSGMPPEMVSLLHKMWKENPNDRLSAEEVVKQLKVVEKQLLGQLPATNDNHNNSNNPSTQQSIEQGLETGQNSCDPSNAGSSESAKVNVCGVKITKMRIIILALLLLVMTIVIAVIGVIAGKGGGGDGKISSSPPGGTQTVPTSGPSTLSMTGDPSTQKSVGRKCDNDADCMSNVCVSGTCSSGAMGGGERCDTNSDCVLGVCAYGAYTANSQLECCASGASRTIYTFQSDSPKSDTANFCTGQSAGERCPNGITEGDELCGSNVCVSGICAAEERAVGEECDNDADCMSNVCVSGTCSSGAMGGKS